jgi:ribonucleoside-diphosphate reductase alpha chain
VNDDFLTAVEKDADWTFTFRGKSYNTVKAREIWDLIMKNMIKSGEPGILNESNLFRNNSYYFAPVVSTNPCGEAILENWGSCCLGSLTLPNFITGAVNTNWQKLEKTIRTAIRFLDNVIDCNKYALKEIDIAGHNSRRVGLGVMGLADYLFAKQVKYGSKESVAEIEKLMRFIRDVAYQTSVELATEKGAFPKFDPVLYGKAHFIRTLPASLRMDIKTKGIRNVTLMAGAPTGTISLLPEVTSGIEPLIYKSYKRSDRVSERIYIHPKYRQLLLSGEPIPEWFVDMTELQPKDHLEVQTAATKFVDGAVSKTINCPFETTENQLSALLLEYLRDLKGVTVYREGSKFGQVYNSLTEEEALEYIAANMVSSSLTEGEIECKCSKKDEEPEQEEIKQEVQIMEI